MGRRKKVVEAQEILLEAPKLKKVPKKSLSLIAENPADFDRSKHGPEMRADCVRCGLFTKCKSPVMPARVPDGWTGKLLIIAEAPGQEEDQKNEPMVGKAGKALDRMLDEVGLNYNDVAITNINRCRPVENATPSMDQVRACRPFVVHDVLRLRPKWVLVMGDNAAKGVWNNGQQSIKKLRQRVFSANEFFGEEASEVKVAFTYHPAATFYAKGQEVGQRIRTDLKWLQSFQGYIGGPRNEAPDTSRAVSLDAEWSDSRQLLTISKSWKDKAVVTESEEEWNRWFADFLKSKPILIGHGIGEDLLTLRLNGLTLPSTWISGQALLDSLMLARLTNENLGAYDLESLASSICRVAPWKRASESNGVKKHTDFSLLSPDVRMERCRIDAWSAGLLTTTLLPKLPKHLVSFTHQIAAVLRRVEMVGVKVDLGKFGSIKELIEGQFNERKATLENFAIQQGWPTSEVGPFECSNDNHFRDLLYNRMGAVPAKYTAKSKDPAVDNASLVLLYQRGTDLEKEAVVKRLRYEKVEKLRSTYVVSLEGKSEDGERGHLTSNGFIFQNINPLGARTGRRSSDSPNMQNWPKRMRSMVVSRFPEGRIVKADYSQLEPRILSVLAGIDEWQEIFHAGKSLYIVAAKRMWKRDVEKDTDLYKITKSTILGTNYGMEVDLFIEKMSVEQGINLTREQGQYILNLYHSSYPALPRFFQLQRERLIHDKQISDMCGQIRRLPNDGERTPGFKHMWNQAVNFPVQGLAAKFTGSALIDVETELLSNCNVKLEEHFDNLVWHYGTEKLGLTKAWLNERLLGGGIEIDYPVTQSEVHDEIDVDTPGKDVDWVTECVRETMASCKTLRSLWPETNRIKVSAEVKPALTWAS